MVNGQGCTRRGWYGEGRWGDQGAGRGGVSFIARVAGTDGIVIPDSARGMDSTGAGAGVSVDAEGPGLDVAASPSITLLSHKHHSLVQVAIH